MADDTSVAMSRDELERRGAAQRAPHALYVTGEDQLRLTVLNALAGVTVTIRGRCEDLSGRVVPFGSTLTPASDRTASQVTVRLGEGWLLNAHAFVSAAAPLTGQTFAILSLIRGEGTAALELATLAAGPITTVQRLSYPGSSVANSLENAGAIRAIGGATPAAGNDVAEVVPTGARWELLSFRATLTTSATVANRYPSMWLDDGTNEFFISNGGGPEAASDAEVHVWVQGVPISSAFLIGRALNPLPTGIRLGAGFRIRTQTNGLQATDQWSAVRYLVREWLEGA